MDPIEQPSSRNRKRKKADNPLAAARGKKKVDVLWHRKTGAAFRLFVEFYSKQPLGVCSDGSIEKKTTNSISKVKTGGAGLSRAALRRKKKKKNQNLPSEEPNAESMEETKPDFDVDHRLEQALHDYVQGNNAIAHIQPFVSALSKPLPLTFRIRNGIPAESERELRSVLEKDFSQSVKPVPFDKRIYKAISPSLSKASLSKKNPVLKSILVEKSLNGTLARQEFGSMLPVLALRKGGWMKKNARVLDLCASPGSKTLQALEAVGVKGRVKANDINANRLDSLREAVGRSGMSELIERVNYSNYDASKYPIPAETRLFSTIICDVPCSGDGTIRKDPHILKDWTPATSNALHSLQVSILTRALQCLKVGGVMTYSTCSLNPVENEAVVAAVLQHGKKMSKFNNNQNSDKYSAAYELLPWPEMDGFIHRPGVSTWKIADYVGECDANDEDKVHLRWHNSFIEASKAKMQHATPSMWPPESAESLQLQLCVRLWPQDLDTGGFFVALLRRNC